MSFYRLAYYSAVVGGWAAFFGWLFSEMFLIRDPQNIGFLTTTLIAAAVGATIGAGLNALAGAANTSRMYLIRRAGPGFVGGLIGGAIGGLCGNLFFYLFQSREIGWVFMGLGIGAVEGLYERSREKIRNGLVGGGIGGLVGGLLFDPISGLVASSSGMSSRAASFVILGVCIGAMIGLVQLVMRNAWIEVVDGWGAGRVKSIDDIDMVLGRSDRLPIPLLNCALVEPEHARIYRNNGTFLIDPISDKSPVKVNDVVVKGPTQLGDSAIIKIGKYSLRFRSKLKDSGQTQAKSDESGNEQPKRPKVPSLPGKTSTTSPQAAPKPANSQITAETTLSEKPSPSTSAQSPAKPRPKLPGL